ncbi:flagellar hook-basal body complex protein [Desulfobotulus mexicanus]|uniref:Flagellar hook protein FlgE n=1 Tax=Desulfobotulus mexicanus TaxID=2586642 RepID=A0A5Q4VH65_9BACT|nr:flagellar hook-basal body complex protein [Desulfobotulus mexicanus]TYT76258.1 flagellar hook-basal body complex protein [Desulfobotulus mexicanus]
MSLTSSLYTGTSGLTNMGRSMQVIGDNISNVNTVGFKGSRYTFADVLNQTVGTQSGSAQMGRGMALGSVDNLHNQGSFESTGNTTDLSIGGNGFFVVRHPASNQEYYTRAGNFNFDKDGKLVTPEGMVVQGWKLDPDTGNDMGAMTSIIMQSFTSPPKQTSEITAITNLDADATSQSVVLSNAWDATKQPPIPPNSYEYQTVVKAYDALGSTHDITIYYDKKSGSDWEYIITMNPSEDKRLGVQGTPGQGLLARGVIHFNESDGSIADMTMEEYTGRIGNVRSEGVNRYDDLTFVLNSTEPMDSDGFDFHVEYDGDRWQFQNLPDAYPNAEIIYSDARRIEIVLNRNPADTDPEPDMVIRLASNAVATDSLKFDINKPRDAHVQNVTGLTYRGDTGNDNTTLTINDPGVMTRDMEGMNLVWNPRGGVDGRGEWYMSNPSEQNVTGQNYGGMTAVDGASETVLNPAVLNQYAAGMQVEWDAVEGWVWRSSSGTASVGAASTAGELTVHNAMVLNRAAVITVPKTAYDDLALTTGWEVLPFAAVAALADYPDAQIRRDGDRVQIDLDGNGTADISFTPEEPADFGGNDIVFSITASPPREYPNARILNDTPLDPGRLAISFDGNNNADVVWSFEDAGGTPAAAGDEETFTFSLDPRTTPEGYPNAVIRGDKDRVYIDLDGSGGDKDREDIVFTFTEPMRHGASVENSVISFDIQGGTSWRQLGARDINNAGYYEFTADFLGSAGRMATDGTYRTTEQKIAFNIGTAFDGLNFINSSLTTTQYARTSSTIYQTADGYGAGDLEGVNVSSEGVMTGMYSNGQLIPLYRVGLAKFMNNQGLYKEGGNLYRETRDSGSAITGRPGSNGLGKLSPNSLEMSNVDIGDEFVRMITTQRGFQANSKTVTTVDGMLETVIQMKR